MRDGLLVQVVTVQVLVHTGQRHVRLETAVRSGQVRAGLGWAGLGWAGQGRAGQDMMWPGWAEAGGKKKPVRNASRSELDASKE